MECSIKSIAGRPRANRTVRWLVLVLACSASTVLAAAQDTSQPAPSPLDQVGAFLGPDRVSGALGTLLLFSALSLAPALLLMTTCFVRISIVLALLRQAIGAQAVPSNQVLAGLALFMTAAIMAPVANEIQQNALIPYREETITWEQAVSRAQFPLHQFMARQIERTGNADDVWLFLERSSNNSSEITSYDQVPFQVLAPAFLVSELKTAFLIGFQIFLPFLVIDLVVASVIAGMGLITVPPVLVSLPAKLLLFVLVDGWHLIVGMLLDSFV